MERVNNGCLKKKKEFSFVTRESSEKKIFFMKEILLPEDTLSTELLSFLKKAIILSLYNIKVLLFTRSVL